MRIKSTTGYEDQRIYYITDVLSLLFNISLENTFLKMATIRGQNTYVVGSKSFRPDIQKPHQMENAVRDI